MKPRGLVRFGVAVAAAAWMAVALPSVTAAQQGPSGRVQVPSVPPSQLPRAGDAATDQSGMLATVVLGSSALVAGFVLRARAQRESGRRRRE